jgi:hypothetical protein
VKSFIAIRNGQSLASRASLRVVVCDEEKRGPIFARSFSMSKLIVIEQFHIDLLISRARATHEVSVAVRGVRQTEFVEALRKAVRAIVGKRRALRKVIVRITR